MASRISLGTSFERLACQRDGNGLYALLKISFPVPQGRARSRSRSRHGESRKASSPAAQKAEASSSAGSLVAAELERAERAGQNEDGLEALCAGMRRWCAEYVRQQTSPPWMVPPLMRLITRARHLAAELDQREKTDKHNRKLVEALRDQFQQLHRDRAKRGGCLAVCCGLLSLYFRLRQASQCGFLLAAVAQSDGGQRCSPEGLPKALAVTFHFLWGKHCVLAGNVVEAEERLGWALSNCPPEDADNRRKVLVYLLPCRMRFGRYPSRGLLRKHGFTHFAALIVACASGDVQRFDKELAALEDELVGNGTFVVVEKLRLLVFRNLCRQVHTAAVAALQAEGKPDVLHKHDLRPYEAAFQWQDDCDADETVCILANLIYIGAIKGYMSDVHQKIVFSKEAPFPSPSVWCPKV